MFAVVVSHEPLLPVATRTLEARVWVSASALPEAGVDVALRLWTPRGAAVVALHERSPDDVRLDDTGRAVDAQTVQYAAGRWTDGTREYELALALPPRLPGDEMLAARFGVVAGGEVVERAPIAVRWTDADAHEPAPTAAVAGPAAGVAAGTGERPTAPSPQPRHTGAQPSPAGACCPHCGAQALDGDRFCERCGRELGDPATS